MAGVWGFTIILVLFFCVVGFDLYCSFEKTLVLYSVVVERAGEKDDRCSGGSWFSSSVYSFSEAVVRVRYYFWTVGLEHAVEGSGL